MTRFGCCAAGVESGFILPPAPVNWLRELVI
jgi:hypothetical protein